MGKGKHDSKSLTIKFKRLSNGRFTLINVLANSEVVKLQQHLSLLKQEYSKLQTKYRDLESRYTYIAATNGDSIDSDVSNSFASRLVNTICNLYESETYSDLKIKLSGERWLLTFNLFVTQIVRKNH